MGTLRWRGDAPAVAQVSTAEFGVYDTATTRTITIGGTTVSRADTGGTLTAALSAFATLLNASTNPRFSEITWSSNATKIIGTADTAGKPITFAGSVSGGTGTLVDAFTTTTANSGPNDWSTASNWSTGAIPVDADDVFIQDSDVDILYGLDQTSIQLTSLTIDQSYTGKIGLPYTNTDNSSYSYIEYRTRYLGIEPTTTNIGRGQGAGSARINLNTDDANVTINVFNTGNPEDGRERALQITGSNASSVLNIEKGSVGIALEAGQTAEFATVRIGYVDNIQGDSQVRIGDGTTLATLLVAGGVNTIGCAVTTATLDEGTTTLEGTGAVTTLIVNGGTCYYNTTGTLTTGTVSGVGSLDFSQDLRTKTVTNAIERFGNSSKIRDPHKVVSSLVVDNNYADDLSPLEIGTNFKITRAAVT